MPKIAQIFVDITNAERYEEARTSVNRVLAEYDFYIIAEVEDTQIDRLRAVGFEVQETSEFRKLEVGEVEFEAEDNRESIGLSSLDGDEEFYVLQVVGPMKDQWKEAIEKLGVSFCYALSYNAFVVRLCFHTIYQVTSIRNMEFIRFITKYQPEFRISSSLKGREGVIPLDEFRALKILPKTIPFSSGGNLMVVLQDSAYLSVASESIVKLGGVVVNTASDFLIVALDPASGAVEKIAELSSVKWISSYKPKKLCLDKSAPILNAPEVWKTHGLTGKGQIIAVADTGLDTGVDNDMNMHPDFIQPSLTRKIVKIYALGRPKDARNPEDASDPDGHGTHVAGASVGNGRASNRTIKGIAYEARLVFQSVMNKKGELDEKPAEGLGGIPADIIKLFKPPYDDCSARIHSNSWGSGSDGKYVGTSRDIDKFVWEHRDMVIVFAAGNEGSDENRDGVIDLVSVGREATAKNCITVGASENDRPDQTTKGEKIWRLPVSKLQDTSAGGLGPLGNQHKGMMFYPGVGDDADEMLENRKRVVAKLQAMLDELGYRDSDGNRLVCDGDFGDRTESAVRSFQSTHQDLGTGAPLVVDGLVGEKTGNALNSVIGPRSIRLRYGKMWPKDYQINPIRDDPVADKPDGVVAFSSRGPVSPSPNAHSPYSRFKPDVIAPGTCILSTKSTKAVDDEESGKSPNQMYMFMSGTSMATPQVSGAAALVRQSMSLLKYADEPSRKLRKKIPLSPTAALVKALLIHGAKKIKGQYADPLKNDAEDHDPDSKGRIPNHSQGFGRVDLEESLFPQAPTVMEIFDGHVLSSNETREYHFLVKDTTVPVKTTLVWTDYPDLEIKGKLRNHLILVAHTPDGKEFHGNYENPQPPNKNLDKQNNVEKIIIKKPIEGVYQIVINCDKKNEDIPGGKGQDYALIVSGDLEKPLIALARQFGNAEQLDPPKLCNKFNPPNPILADGPLVKNDGRDDLVRIAQKMLDHLGHDLGTSGEKHNGVDGAFGAGTEREVKDFQSKNKDWADQPLAVDAKIGPETSDALNRAMVGRWYDFYVTPKVLSGDTLLVTATKEGAMKGIPIGDMTGIRKIKLVFKERMPTMITLREPSGKRFEFNGEGEYEVLDGEEQSLLKGKMKKEDDIKFKDELKMPFTVELKVNKTFYTFYGEKETA